MTTVLEKYEKFFNIEINDLNLNIRNDATACN